jgi:hypothetical protein
MSIGGNANARYDLISKRTGSAGGRSIISGEFKSCLSGVSSRRSTLDI